jgi:UDP-N-acetylglucosamine kinase
MNNEELLIKEKAQEFANRNKKEIAKEYTSVEKFTPESNPVSVFMAGSPGAGKTEVSKRLLDETVKDNKRILRIDTDDLREKFEDYNGSNSHLFHLPASILASKIHDKALKNKQSFIFDGTFSNLNYARENINRSISRDRFVKILYVYQDPINAWIFVEMRELVEGRRIKKQDFVNKYFLSRFVVEKMKKEYGKSIQVDILVKNTDGSDKVYYRNVESIDIYIPETYTKDKLEKDL